VAGGLCAAAALALWLVAISASWVAGCPQSSAVAGFDGGVSAWPPGANCLRDAADSGPFVYEALPWAEVAVVALLALATIVLAAGLLGAVRGLRWRRDRSAGSRVADDRASAAGLGARADQQAELARLGDQGAVGRPELAVLLEEPVTDEPRAKAA
jgi:hypothetical protein